MKVNTSMSREERGSNKAHEKAKKGKVTEEERRRALEYGIFEAGRVEIEKPLEHRT